MNDLNLGNGSQKGKQKLMIKKIRELIFTKKKKKRERTTCALKDIINKIKRLQNGRKYYLQFTHLVWDLKRIYIRILKTIIKYK